MIVAPLPLMLRDVAAISGRVAAVVVASVLNSVLLFALFLAINRRRKR